MDIIEYIVNDIERHSQSHTYDQSKDIIVIEFETILSTIEEYKEDIVDGVIRRLKKDGYDIS